MMRRPGATRRGSPSWKPAASCGGGAGASHPICGRAAREPMPTPSPSFSLSATTGDEAAPGPVVVEMTDSPPRVSVIMPVFDAGRDLEQAVRSVAAQTFSDRELVIVDDGSHDSTTLAILETAARQPGVSLHRTPNGGPSRARNLAIERARGAYLLPLDADDWLEPTFLEKTVPLLDAAPAVGVGHTLGGSTCLHRRGWRTG